MGLGSDERRAILGDFEQIVNMFKGTFPVHQKNIC